MAYAPLRNQYHPSAAKNTFAAQVTLYLKGIFSDKNQKTEDIANALKTSYRTLARKFRNETGTTISEALSQIRLDNAKRLLISTDLPIYMIAVESGFENELAAKTVRHDFRHHNQNIASMLNKGEIREALSYLEEYNDSLSAPKLNDFCPNITVNAILNSFCTKSQKNGIPFSVNADTPENTAISDMDFVAVLSNLLENAVNGCIECKSNGEINVNIRTVADKTVIVCSNPCKSDISIENNMIKNRGIGIASMLSAIRKYDGNIKYSLDNGILTVCVILNS